MGLLEPDAGYRIGDGRPFVTPAPALRALQSADEVDPSALRDLLLPYFQWIAAELETNSDLRIDPDETVTGILSDLEKFAPPKGCIILADQGGVLTGCIFLRRIRESAGEVKSLYVRPEARTHGLGGKLLAHLISEARAVGIDHLFLDTAGFMKDAIRFYEKAGFVEIDRYPENANPPEFASILRYMELRLT